mmetsp:Transcript_19964/g.62800  ORF Transcript_19964/g.62800 Transcript_19964/m.62800 type:complete len:232 (-) Transcript_19964:61-756(-)
MSSKTGRAAAWAVTKRYRGTHSRGWWHKYQREGPSGFVRAEAPRAFDFEAGDAATKAARSRCYFALRVDEQEIGRVEFELVDELLPMTCGNFRLLCSGRAPSGFSYRNSKFARRIVKNVAVVGGNVEAPGGSHSAFEESRYFPDEGFFIPHAGPGILSMANCGVDTNGSQFYVTLDAAPHMDGRCVAFGRVVAGLDHIAKINETVFCQKGKPVQSVLIADCGLLPSAAPPQ